MVHTDVAANDVRLPITPAPGEAVVITRYGKPEYAVVRWKDFEPMERLIDHYLTKPPYDLEASDLAIRAAAVDRQPDGDDFDYSGLAEALDQ